MIALGLGAAAFVAARPLGSRGPNVHPPPVDPGFSLVAVGDTGRPPHWLDAVNGQMAVARGIERVDDRRPIDALLLLGDNFYFEGLREDNLVGRVRGNLVHPYCRFVALTADRSGEVADGCAVPSAARRPIPLLATVGNHDIASDESVRLESEGIPRFVANWRLSAKPVETFEPAPGVSLILFDSNRSQAPDVAALRDAIRAAPGPWRVLVAHHPIGTSRDHGYSVERGVGSYGERVERAVAEAGVPVTLMLAAHEHNLQLLQLSSPGPALEVIAGGGSHAFPIESSTQAPRVALGSLGFARVDFPGDPSGRVRVTLFATSKLAAWLGREPRVVAHGSVDLSGHVHIEAVGGEAG
jgi:hypothetical protein